MRGIRRLNQVRGETRTWGLSFQAELDDRGATLSGTPTVEIVQIDATTGAVSVVSTGFTITNEQTGTVTLSDGGDDACVLFQLAIATSVDISATYYVRASCATADGDTLIAADENGQLPVLSIKA